MAKTALIILVFHDRDNRKNTNFSNEEIASGMQQREKPR
jgi:hypothetical protein